jgi:hypothetical protein
MGADPGRFAELVRQRHVVVKQVSENVIAKFLVTCSKGIKKRRWDTDVHCPEERWMIIGDIEHGRNGRQRRKNGDPAAAADR